MVYEPGRSEVGECSGRICDGPNKLLKEGSCVRGAASEAVSPRGVTSSVLLPTDMSVLAAGS